MNAPGTIERGVPPPKRVIGVAWGKRQYPYFAQMIPGDSVVEDTLGCRAFRNYGFRHKWKVATAKIGGGQHRCWRLS
jgi:hypothetical protein